jgi:hypothetical protein
VKEVKARYSWDLPSLKPGEVQQLSVLETGANPMSFGHRVGLPANFSKKMLEYADRTGITGMMRKYVTDGEPLEIGGQERTRINGGVCSPLKRAVRMYGGSEKLTSLSLACRRFGGLNDFLHDGNQT